MRFRPLLFVSSVLLVVGPCLVVNAQDAAVIGAPGEPVFFEPSALDHLKCYRIRSLDRESYGQPPIGPVRLFNAFGYEECYLQVPAYKMCTETHKYAVGQEPVGDDPRRGRVRDFLCYHIRCPMVEPIAKRTYGSDQFGRWRFEVNVEYPTELCTPFRKTRPKYDPRNPA